MINIVFITDNNYVFLTKIAIKSVITNKKQDTKYNIFIIGVNLNDDNYKILYDLNTKDININIIRETNRYENIDSYSSYVSKAALFKFQIPNILNDLDKVIYMDGDVIVQKDLTELYNNDLTDFYAGVVEVTFTKEEMLEGLPLTKYFNSGVMLLNLKKMRYDNIPDKLLEYKKHELRKIFMDQDALNVVFNENVLFLDTKYNYLTADPNFNDIDEKNAVILHMAGCKPWQDIYTSRFKEFWKYMDNIDIIRLIDNMFLKKISTLNNQSINNQSINKENSKKLKKIIVNFISSFIFIKQWRHDFRKYFLKKDIKEKDNKKINIIDNLAEKYGFKNCYIHSTTEIYHVENLSMGNNVWIGDKCKFLVGKAGIKIGNNVAIALNNTFITNNHNYKSDKLLPFDEMNFSYPIEVGNNVWIGLGCIVLGGVKIGDGAVIAAGSVLTKSVPECAIVAGNPAKIVGWRDKDVFNKLIENGDFFKMGTELKSTVVNKFKPFLEE